MPTSRLILKACRRAASAESHRLGRGVNSLATVTTVAPLLGLLATAIGIIGSFKGAIGEKSAIFAAIIGSIAVALQSNAWSLALSILVLFARNVLTNRLQALELEMDSLSLALANALRR